MYDKSTGEPHCFQVDNGAATTTPGACNDIQPETQTASVAEAGGDTSQGGVTSGSAPIITINGNNPATISVGTTFGDLGALITGPTEADKNLGLRIFVNGRELSPVETAQIDTSAPGEHAIDYVAQNSFGTATSTRTVSVVAPNAALTTYEVVNAIEATSTPTTTDTATSTTP